MNQQEFDRAHRATLRQGRDGLRARFGADPNCTAFGLGYRQQNGETTDEPVVIAMVAKKRPQNLVARSRLLPRQVSISGQTYGVDVIEAGPFSVQRPEGTDQLRVLDPDGQNWRVPMPIWQKVRPATEGTGIANLDGFGIGTFGCLVRDRTDQTICLLSCNHVVANLNLGRVGQHIIQPGDGGLDDNNTIARLKRFVPLSFDPQAPGNVDGGIAQVVDESLVSKGIYGGLMPPISSSHPAVGVLFAGDSYGGIFITDMARTLNALNVELLASNAVATAQLDMNVDKVGRTTAYTANKISGLDFTVAVGTEGIPGVPPAMYMTNVHYIANFGWSGDSGSVVCAGGNANRPVYTLVAGCFMFPVVPDMYDLPATATAEFADRIRDEFFALTRVGRLMIEVIYLNEAQIRSKTEGVEASDNEKSYANSLYDKYRDFLESALNNPDSPEYVITEAHYNDAVTALTGIQLRATPAQTTAARALVVEVLRPAIGMNYRQVLAYLDDMATYRKVYSILAADPDIVLHSPAEAF
ncbi:hypothetical protein [Fodinicola acaciae]|uniref:hypothetical protein n=1 Tax=Fodinicola acaciae TaxID=2681555 RepID=UPI0013D73F53|nr:hypothetical protein [Fodinicola acaciae]